MVREWSLNLENTGGKKGLKDPLGYKVDVSGLTIRTGRDSSQQTQVETYERVSINQLLCLILSLLYIYIESI